MPKKDAASTILGMLSTNGARTKPDTEPAGSRDEEATVDRGSEGGEHLSGAADSNGAAAKDAECIIEERTTGPAEPIADPAAEREAEAPDAPDLEGREAASDGDAQLKGAPLKNVHILPGAGGAQKAPSTIRLTPEAAQALREAWLTAKRDDLLLSATDFASALVLSSLKSRKRAAARAINRG